MRRLRDDSGQGVVEFAMVLPLFAALVLAFIGLGKAVYYYLGVTHLSEEGARLAAVSAATMPDGTSGTLGAYLCSKITTSDTGIDKAKVTVSYPNGSPINQGDPVTITITTKYHLIPYFSAADIPINGGATMRVEATPAITGSTAIAAGTTQC